MKNSDIENHMTKSEIIEAVNEFIVGNNAERDRKILIRALVDGLTYGQLEQEFDLSRTQISKILPKRKRQLFAKWGRE